MPVDPASIPSMPTWAIVGIIVVGFAALLPLVLALLYMGQWVGRIDTRATNAEKAAELARERAQDLANQLMEHKQQVATDYVRHGALEQLEHRLMGAISELRAFMQQVFTTKGPTS